MKLPKKTKRYCRKCKNHTEHKIDLVSTGHKRGTLKRGSIIRGKKRGAYPGKGNKPKGGSKPAIKSWKRKTKTSTRKVLIYTCNTCKKSSLAKSSKRVSKILFEAKEK
jgi:ribosomal protein L44E